MRPGAPTALFVSSHMPPSQMDQITKYKDLGAKRVHVVHLTDWAEVERCGLLLGVGRLGNGMFTM